MAKRIGKQTIKFERIPRILSSASMVGPKEGKGPLKTTFDEIIEDQLFGENTWEEAESKFLRETIKLAVQKGNLNIEDIRCIYCGDLLNQLIATAFAIKEFNKPFFGLYGACSTMGEALILSSIAVDGGSADICVAATSSHFCSAEKQFRYPLEYGGQRVKTSTWTVTGSGAVVLSEVGTNIGITYATPGKIVDMGVKDAMNMGAAMAPAAADTIVNFFHDTGFSPDEFDAIATGDLGEVGKNLLIELLAQEGLDIKNVHMDCGIEIFDKESQKTNAGGSGCGCAASVLSGYLLNKLRTKEINKILFIPTGALMSTISSNQGNSIPSVAHGVVIENIE
jgi:stage V sporulation protein AD